MIVIVSLFCGLIVTFYLYLTWNYDHWLKRSVPAPKPALVGGNIPSMVSRKRNYVYDLDEIYQNYNGKHRLIGYFNMRTPRLLLLDPELIKDVMIRNFTKFHDNEFGGEIDKETDPIFANSPFILQGAEWKEKRGEISPAFTSSRLKSMYPLVEKVCSDMVEYINLEIEKASPEGIDTKELTAKFTTDVVSDCVFAMNAESFKNAEAEIRKMGKQLMTPTLKFVILSTLIQVIPLLKRVLKVPFIPKHIEGFFVSIMRNAIKHRQENQIDRTDFLQYLLSLKDKKELSDLQTVSHVMTFFVDGFETSSIAMASALYELAKDERVQDKLREQIKEVESKGKLNFDTVEGISYLDQVIYETLRLHPPAATLGRKCTEETSFKINYGDESAEVKVKVGDVVSVPIYSMHRDPNFFNDPLTFNPERFDTENGGVKAFRDKCVFLPFGDGPRICLGQKFALMQVKAGIVEIIKNFQVTVNSKTKEPLSIDPNEFIFSPIGGYWLNFKKF